MSSTFTLKNQDYLAYKFNPDFAIENGIRRKGKLFLRLKKVHQYLRVLIHFFHVYQKPSFPSRFVVPIAKSGFNNKDTINFNPEFCNSSFFNSIQLQIEPVAF